MVYQNNIGPHVYNLVFYGDLKSFKMKDLSPPLAKLRDTYYRSNSDDTETKKADQAESHKTELIKNIEIDALPNDFNIQWKSPIITLVDIYDAIGKNSIPLNYEYGQDYPSTAKKVLLIPL